MWLSDHSQSAKHALSIEEGQVQYAPEGYLDSCTPSISSGRKEVHFERTFVQNAPLRMLERSILIGSDGWIPYENIINAF